MFADKLVADTRCALAVAPEDSHDSDAVSLDHISLLFSQDDYGWARQMGGPELENDLRRRRYRSVVSLLEELRTQSQSQLDAWRRVAAEANDYSGADPVLEMVQLRVGLMALRAMAYWRIARGWPTPAPTPVLTWCERPSRRAAGAIV